MIRLLHGILATCAIGSLLFLAYVSGHFVFQKVKNHTNDLGREEKLSLLSDNEKEILTLEPQKLICITSFRNYVEIWFLKDGKLEKKVLRSSLVRMEECVQGIPMIQRCHRAYLVNTHMITMRKLNAHGGYLQLMDKKDLRIPVSRKYVVGFLG